MKSTLYANDNLRRPICETILYHLKGWDTRYESLAVVQQFSSQQPEAYLAHLFAVGVTTAIMIFLEGQNTTVVISVTLTPIFQRVWPATYWDRYPDFRGIQIQTIIYRPDHSPDYNI